MKINEILTEAQLEELNVKSYAKQPFRELGNIGTNLVHGVQGYNRQAGRGVDGRYKKTGTTATVAHGVGKGVRAGVKAAEPYMPAAAAYTNDLANTIKQNAAPGGSMFTKATTTATKRAPVGTKIPTKSGQTWEKTNDGWVNAQANRTASETEAAALDKQWADQQGKLPATQQPVQQPQVAKPAQPVKPAAKVQQPTQQATTQQPVQQPTTLQSPLSNLTKQQRDALRQQLQATA